MYNAPNLSKEEDVKKPNERKIARLKATWESLDQTIAEIEVKKELSVRRLLIGCGICGRKSLLHRWTFIQNEYYVPPTGCTGGDYYKQDKPDTCHLQCPKCHRRNYIYNHPQRPLIVFALTLSLFRIQKYFDAKIVYVKD
jgi:hypothetical protein